jgi:energy-converting hydrogenase A subunit R
VRVFISDCEGPISKNDNAFETASNFVPNGDRLFTVTSRYDDVLADVLRRRGYKAGDTLKLILPFLKAYNVTDRKMREFSAKHLVLIPDAKKSLQHVRDITRAFIISASYEHYMKALCHAIEFPFEDTYCTRFSIDKYTTTEKEKTRLKQIAQEISQMPTIELPPHAKSIKDLSEGDQKTIHKLDEIFWKEIAKMSLARIYSEVVPVGGSEKADAVKDIVHKRHITLADTMYVGDSITDEEAFKLVRKNGGLTVSFNGNEHAIKAAEIAVLSENSTVTAIIADTFIKSGKQDALNLAESWSRESLKKSSADQRLLTHLLRLYPSLLPKVKIIARENMEILAEESSEFRKKVRGEAIGRLG